ncbi:hypothetical protein EC988_001582 [Linderina pennispora]|nr:hypothetical protein EC988_001582 [Linderina pennispora]
MEPEEPEEPEGGARETKDAENNGFDQSHHHYDSITFSYAALKSSPASEAAAEPPVEAKGQPPVQEETVDTKSDEDAPTDTEKRASLIETTPVADESAAEPQDATAAAVPPSGVSGSASDASDSNVEAPSSAGDVVQATAASATSGSEESLVVPPAAVPEPATSVLADFDIFNFDSTTSMATDPTANMFSITIPAESAVDAPVSGSKRASMHEAEKSQEEEEAKDDQGKEEAGCEAAPPKHDMPSSQPVSPQPDSNRPTSPASYRSRARSRRGSLASALAREGSRQAETKLQKALSGNELRKISIAKETTPEAGPEQSPEAAPKTISETAPTAAQPKQNIGGASEPAQARPGRLPAAQEHRAQTAKSRLSTIGRTNPGLQRQPSRILSGLSRRMQSVRHTTSMVLRRTARPIFAPRNERSADNLRPKAVDARVDANDDVPPRYLASEDSDKNIGGSDFDHDGFDGKMSVEMAAMHKGARNVTSTAVARAGLGTLSGRLNTLKRSTSVVVRSSMTRAKSLFVPKRSPGVAV